MNRDVAPTVRPRHVWAFITTALLSLIGLADAVYLTVEHLTGASLRCTIIAGCSEVLSSSYAHIGPLPLAAVGASAYFAVFSLSVLAIFGYPLVRTVLLALVLLMFLMTVWLLYLQAFVIHHFCQYCLLSAAVTTALMIVVLIFKFTDRQAN